MTWQRRHVSESSGGPSLEETILEPDSDSPPGFRQGEVRGAALRRSCSRAPPGGECEEDLASITGLCDLFVRDEKRIQKDKVESW